MSPPRFILDGKGGLTPETAEAQTALSPWMGRFTLLPTAPDLLTFVRGPARGGKSTSPKVVLAGEASGFPLPDLIAFLSQSRWGGTVRLYGPEGERSISLKEGEVRSATSEGAADRLGEVMVRMGYVKRPELEAVLREVPPSKVGRALVDRGHLKAHDLYKCVQHQVSEIFHAMVLCKEGAFVLIDQEPDDKAGAGLQLSTQSLLMDSIRKIDEMAHFRHRIAHGRMYVVGKRGSDGKLEEEEAAVLKLVHGTQTVLELGQAAKLSEFDVTKVIFRLLEGGYVAVSESPMTAHEHVGAAAGSGADVGLIVRTFNQIFSEILQEVGKQGMGREFLVAANAALTGQALSPSPVLAGLTFQPEGTLAEPALLAQFKRHQKALGPEPLSALRQSLSDVMFFLLFQAGELLESHADEELARRVKELLAGLGE